MHLDNRFKGSNRFNKIQIDKTNRIKERKSLGFGEDIFDFSDSLKSINVAPLEFTNYFNSRRDVMFKFVKKEYKKFLYSKVDLDNEYEMKLVNVEDKFVQLKITKLYSETLGKKVRQLPTMYKLKCLENPKLQFYVINDNHIFKICFIDIYHLAITTEEQDAKEIYLFHQNDSYDLSNLDNGGNNITNNKELETIGN